MDFSQNRVLTLEQGRQYLGYAMSYVYKLTSGGILPHSKPNGKTIFFDREKLEAWMLSNPKSSAAEKKIEAATHIESKTFKVRQGQPKNYSKINKKNDRGSK
jgi:predicted DNA-binding transcriptional regulator AlpA